MTVLSPGDFLASYQLEQEIAEGGAALLFRARHIHPAYAEQAYAIKVLHESRASDPTFLKNFRQEAAVLSTLKHRGIVSTFDAGIDENNPYIALEYVHGGDFGDVLDSHDGLMPQPLAFYIIGEVLEALDYAHDIEDSGGKALGVIHRDIKPSNILISFDGRVKITDFGIAALMSEGPTRARGKVLGTKGYFAPEQLAGKDTDRRADIYAMGVVMFEALCGEAPYETDRTSRLLKLNRMGKTRSPRKVNRYLPAPIEKILNKSLERRPEDRYSTCREILADLAPYLPSAVGMQLALGSFVRGLFPSRAAPVGRKSLPQKLPPGLHVACCSDDPSLIAGLRVPVSRVEMKLSAHESIASIAGTVEPIHALMVDTDAPGFDQRQVLALRASARAPLIALCRDLSGRSLRSAHAIGAEELLVLPVSERRVIHTLQRLLLSTPVAASALKTESDSPRPVRALIVSPDPAIHALLAEDLANWNVTLDLAPTKVAALRVLDQRTYEAVVMDRSPLSADIKFVSRVRSLPGIGMMPILHLLEPTAPETQPPLQVRTMVRSRELQPVVLVSAINQLRAMIHTGRCFSRFDYRAPAELSYGGNAIDCETRDISRGGVLLSSTHFPQVGSACRVMLYPEGEAPLPLFGRVVRVLLEGEGEAAGLGVSFFPGGDDVEKRLTELVRRVVEPT